MVGDGGVEPLADVFAREFGGGGEDVGAAAVEHARPGPVDETGGAVDERGGGVVERHGRVEGDLGEGRPVVRRGDGGQRGDAVVPAHPRDEVAGVEAAHRVGDEVQARRPGLGEHRPEALGPHRRPRRDGLVRGDVWRVRPDAVQAQPQRFVVQVPLALDARDHPESVHQHDRTRQANERRLRHRLETGHAAQHPQRKRRGHRSGSKVVGGATPWGQRFRG